MLVNPLYNSGGSELKEINQLGKLSEKEPDTNPVL